MGNNSGRTKKALTNVITSILSELVTLLCGLVIPKLILSNFGSTYNGITQSITQFISTISLMKAGIGGATRAALYKPLADKDNTKISKILASTETFMRRISFIFVAFVFVLAFVYPIFINNEFDWFFTSSLIVIISLSTFAQYYFGFTYQMLLMADQKMYIITFSEIISTIINTIVAIVLINGNCSIHIVKLGSSAVSLITPLFLYFYVRKKYNIVTCKNTEPVPQRWDAVAHEVAKFINTNTDIMVLTVFSNLLEVSVYTVYHYVIVNIKKIIQTFVSSFGNAFGNMYANKEYEIMNENMGIYELILFSFVSIVYSVTLVMIVPFITVYTKGINDTNYIRPLFAIILTLSGAFDCFRIPYMTIVNAVGHFKQTKNGAIIEAVINITLSIILVYKFGLIGVSIGTLVAMAFRSSQFAYYLSKNIINRNFSIYLKHVLLSFSIMSIVYFVSKMFLPNAFNGYFMWIIYATISTIFATLLTMIINFIFYKNDMINLVSKLKNNFNIGDILHGKK